MSAPRPDRRQIAARYRAGETGSAIAADLGITRQRVSQILGELGLSGPRGRRRLRDPDALARAKKVRVEAQCRARWGISLAEYRSLVARYGTTANTRSPLHIYGAQKRNATRCGGQWQLSFREWWALWECSGKWPQRGKTGYCLLRLDPAGPFAIGNVRIATAAERMCRVLDRIRP